MIRMKWLRSCRKCWKCTYSSLYSVSEKSWVISIRNLINGISPDPIEPKKKCYTKNSEDEFLRDSTHTHWICSSIEKNIFFATERIFYFLFILSSMTAVAIHALSDSADQKRGMVIFVVIYFSTSQDIPCDSLPITRCIFSGHSRISWIFSPSRYAP